MLGNRQSGESDASACARRLVHLSVHEGALRTFGRAVVLLRVDVDVRLDHLVIEVVALARALTDAGEHRVAAVGLGDVVDELHDQHGLADAGTAEEADLAALGVGRQQVHDLDARDEHLGFRRLVGEGRSGLMDGALCRRGDRAGLVHGLANHVHDSAEGLVTDGHRDRLARVRDVLAAREPFGAVHGDRAHGVLAQVLGDLEDEALALVHGLERVQDLGQMPVELHVDDGAHHLADLTYFVRCHALFS